jgi:hypothetical protein
MRRIFTAAVILAVLALGAAHAQAPEPPVGADLVVTNGVIYTGDDRLGRVQALAVRDGVIIAVGTSAEIKHWVGPGTRVLDLKGSFAMAGFNDAHTHFGSGGQGLLAVNVEGARSLAEFQARIRARLAEFEPGEWVVGRGWDQSLWPENRMPTRADLDAVSTKHPMIFGRVDGHSAVANSLALTLAAITRDTPNPAGGEIVRDPQGEPTGWLKENAEEMVWRLVPPPAPEQRKRGLLLAMEQAARWGVTSIQDNSSWEDFLAFRQLKNEGKLTLRVTGWLNFRAPVGELDNLRREGGSSDPWLKTGALKGVTDGSGGSLSAAMLEPFATDASNRGILLYDPDELKNMAAEREAAGFQLALHAIGDRANRIALDAFAAARQANQRRNTRHRIEHAQFIHRDDVPRFRELGVVASVQPCHVLSDLRWAPKILGPEREYEGYPYGSLAHAGAILAFGTDFPVEPLHPLRNLYAAVAREFETGGPASGWLPDEKLSLENGIRAYTWGSAYAEFEEQRKGTLTPGRFADIVVLSQDITRVPPRELLQTDVLLTLVGGKVVYEKK